MMSELNDTIKHTLQVKKGGVEILNPEVACGVLMDKLIFNAVFHPETQIKATSRWLIKAIAQNLNIFSSSTQAIQDIFNPPSMEKMNIPVLQIPHLSYDIARAVFQAIQKHPLGPVIFELGKAPLELAYQAPGEFTVTILAAAIREKYQGPIFFQAHPIQCDMESFHTAPDQEIQKLTYRIIESIDAGIYNLWIDGLSLSQSPNWGINKNPSAQLLAIVTDIIREHEPKNVNISLGGLIKGHGDPKIFEKNVISFLDDYRKNLQRIRQDIKGICKVSFHSFEPLQLEADVYRLLHNQHGLSAIIPLNSMNLPREGLQGFSDIGGMEFPINMPFHNLFIEHTDLPKNIRTTLMEFSSHPSTNIKKTLWTLPHALREDIRTQFEEKITLIFKTFKTPNTLEDLQRNTPNPMIPLSLSTEMKALQK